MTSNYKGVKKWIGNYGCKQLSHIKYLRLLIGNTI